MDYQVILSASARADLRNIVRYISLDAPDRALRFGMFLISRTRFLAHSPELGRVVPEFGDPSLREIIIQSYRVVYRVDERNSSVQVIRFWHAARGVPEMDR